jgi:Phosphatidylglycerophosphate synthase
MMVCGFLFYTLRSGLPQVAIPGWLTFLVFIRDFLIMVFAYLLYTRVQITRFPPSWAGKMSTLAQAVTLAATIGANSFFPGLVGFAGICFKITLGVTLFSGWDYLRRGDRMLHEGAPPGRTPLDRSLTLP